MRLAKKLSGDAIGLKQFLLELAGWAGIGSEEA